MGSRLSINMINDSNIIYEDEYILVLNKPAGVQVHADEDTKGETVSDWFVARCPEAVNVGELFMSRTGKEMHKPGIVHRLDRETSGVLLLVKDQETFLYIKERFKERKVAKTYHAFVYGSVKDDKGVIDRPIGRSSSDFRLRSAQRGARGTLRPAVTEYAVIKRTPEFSYLELHPKTGRTHQLRAHLKAINHPIVCDRLYAPKHLSAMPVHAGQAEEPALGFARLALHASALELDIREGVHKRFEAPLPDEFDMALKLLASAKY